MMCPDCLPKPENGKNCPAIRSPICHSNTLRQENKAEPPRVRGAAGAGRKSECVTELVSNQPPLLADAIPELAKELESLLVKTGESNLAAQVQQIQIVDRCRCGDDFCATFYAVPPPKGSWGVGHRNVSLDCETGMLILDVVDDKITCVEVIDREEIRQRLHELLP